MAFSRPVFTNAGKELQAKALAGECEIKFTAIALGSGELITQSIAELTDLIKPIKRCELTEIKHTAIDTIQLKSKFENTSQTSGFYWREVGLFAADPNEPSNRDADILYCYQNAGDIAEYIAAPDQQIIDKILCMAIAISDSAKVSAVIKSELYADREEFNAHLTDAEAHKDLLNNFAKSVNTYGVLKNNNIELPLIRNSYAEDNQKYSSVFGGEAYGKGAGLFAYGAKHAEYPGYFDLYAMTSEGEKAELVGTPAGSLTWQGHEVITAKGGHLTGTLFTNQIVGMAKENASGDIVICGGTNPGDGAYIQAYGADSEVTPREIYLCCQLDSDNALRLTNDGLAVWGGKNLVRSVNGVNADNAGNVTISASMNVDYSAGISVSAPLPTQKFTAPCNGIYVCTPNTDCLETLYINEIATAFSSFDDNTGQYATSITVPLSKGDVIYWDKLYSNSTVTSAFYPFK